MLFHISFVLVFGVRHKISSRYFLSVLEVYQFARDASVAEAWLIAHEPYLTSTEYGDTLDMVEALIKKHEAFEKSAATQEERFAALERLTTVRYCVFSNQISPIVNPYVPL